MFLAEQHILNSCLHRLRKTSLGLASALLLPISMLATSAQAAPQGGQVVSGNAAISQVGNTTNINQSSNKAIINWQQFNIGKHETVNFNQPNAHSSTLNRVIGVSPSMIEGMMNANGQVFLINPNGIVFSKDATVNVGGLVASTRDISDENFNNGNYVFEGKSSASIFNAGKISASDKGYVALLGQEVVNKGVIAAQKGFVALAAGDKITLNLNGNSLTKLTVDESTYRGLVKNQGIIEANGGQVFLTADALDKVIAGVVNNEGIIEANAIGENQGQVVLFADNINVDGEISANTILAGNLKNTKTTVKSTAQLTGDFVETSGRALKVENGATIKANKWLLDPENLTIGTDADVTAATLEASLNSGTNITLTAEKNIYVNENITWNQGVLGLWAGWDGDDTSGSRLNNDGSIFVNAVMTGTGAAGIDLKYGTNGTIRTLLQAEKDNPNIFDASTNARGNTKGFFGKINFSGSGGVKINGDTYTRINDFNALKTLTPTGKYYLGADLNDVTGVNWATYNANFSGVLEGFGHVIPHLQSNANGLFASNFSGIARNFGINGGSIASTATNSVGMIAGSMKGGKIENVYAQTGLINSGNTVGGLVGEMTGGEIAHSFKAGAVQGVSHVGGLVGYMTAGTIRDSYTWSDVTITTGTNAGGLVGWLSGTGKIYNSRANGNYVKRNTVNTGTDTRVGGFVGTISNANAFIDGSYSYVTTVQNGRDIGGFVSYFNGGTIQNSASYTNVNSGNTIWAGGFGGYVDANAKSLNNKAYGTVTGSEEVGGMFGFATNATIEDNHYLGKSVTGTGMHVGGLIGRTGAGITITNSSAKGVISSSKRHVGGLVGYVTQNITLNNVWFGDFVTVTDPLTGKISLDFEGETPKLASSITAKVTSNDYGVGGLIGFSQNGDINIIGGYVAASELVGLRSVGGIVGENHQNASFSLINSTDKINLIHINEIKTTAHVSNQSRIGGVAGRIERAFHLENTNIYVNKINNGNYSYVGGLVGYRDYSGSAVTVDNVNLSIKNGLSGSDWIGGFFGYINGPATIKNSSVDITGNIAANSRWAGGMVGYTSMPVVFENIDVLVKGNIQAGSYNAGGLVGQAGGAVTVKGSQNAGVNSNQVKITGSIQSGNAVGGLVGNAVGHLLIENIDLMVGDKITATSATGRVGGFVGHATNNIVINHSSLKGDNLIIGGVANAQDIGGAVGWHNSNGYFRFDGVLIDVKEIKGAQSVGGLIGRTDSMTNGVNKSWIKNTAVTVADGITGESFTAGLVGRYYQTNSSQLLDIESTHVKANITGESYSAGFVGSAPTNMTMNVTDSSFEGDLTATGDRAGGIVGSGTGTLNLTKVTVGKTDQSNKFTSSYFSLGGVIGSADGVVNSDGVQVNLELLQGTNHVGGFAGSISGAFNATDSEINIKEIKATATVANVYLGGLAGSTANSVNINGVLINSDLIATPSNGQGHVGGLIGVQNGNFLVLINNAEVKVAAINGYFRAGGLIGESASQNINNKIENTKVSAHLAGRNYIGGLLGIVVNANARWTIDNAHYQGVITNTGAWTGGFVGSSATSDLVIRNSFVGEFDASGNPITTASTKLSGGGQGTAGFAGSARNLTVTDSQVNVDSITSSGADSAAVVGTLEGLANLNGVQVNANLVKGTTSIGGLIGYMRNAGVSTIENSIVKIGRVEGTYPVGGLVAHQGNANAHLQIRNSSFAGHVNQIVHNATYGAGGFVGTAKGTVNISNSFVGDFEADGSAKANPTSKVTSVGVYTGGLVGFFTKGTQRNNKVNLAEVSSTRSQVGGMIGKANNILVITGAQVRVVNLKGASDVGGLVGWMAGANSDIKNAVVSGDFTSAGNYLGGLVGRITAKTTISNSRYENGTLKGANMTGGLVGDFASGSITHSFVDNATVKGAIAIGGLVGVASRDAVINNSGSNASVSGTGHEVGGLVGVMYDNSSITASYALGNVEGSTNMVGGLVGRIVQGTITNSYATGAVTGKAQVGGLVGSFAGTGNINTSYATGKVTGTDAATTRGLVGQSTKAPVNSFYLLSDDNVDNRGLTQDSNNIGIDITDLRSYEFLQSKGWNIVLEPNLEKKLYPQLRWTCAAGEICEGKMNGALSAGTSVWVIGYGKDFVTYQLNEKHETYDATNHMDHNPWDFGTENKIWIEGEADTSIFADLTYGVDYWFAVNGVRLTSVKDAGTYDNIQLVIDHRDYMVDPTAQVGTTPNQDLGLGKFVIDPAQITLTANDVTKTYDATNFANGAGYSVTTGTLYAGDVLTGALVYGGSSQGAKNAGTYVLEIGGVSNSNYAITFIDGELVINKATLVVSPKDFSKTYDAQEYTGTPGVVYSGFASGENESNLNGNLVYTFIDSNSNAVVQPRNAGNYAINLEANSTLASDNYDIQYRTANLEVRKANLTIAVDNVLYLYKEDAEGKAIGYVGFGGGENGQNTVHENMKGNWFTALGLLGTDNLDDAVSGWSYAQMGNPVTNPAHAGGYEILVAFDPNNATANNYNITYKNGLLAISEKPLMIDAGDITKTYNGQGGFGGQDVGLVYKALVNENGVETYVKYTEAEFQAMNLGALTDVSDISSFAEFIFGVKDASSKVNAGSYDIELEATQGFNKVNEGGYEFTRVGHVDANNDFHVDFDIFFTTGVLTINKAALDIYIDEDKVNHTYDGTNYNPDVNNLDNYLKTGVGTGFVNGESWTNLDGTAQFTFNGSTALVKNAGTYLMSVGGLTSNNYDIHFFEGQMTIAKKQLTVTANDDSKTYDGALYHGGNGVTYDGFAGSEDANVLDGQLMYGGNAQNAKNAGSYVIAVSGLEAQNYSFNYVDGALTITPANLTITANNGTETYKGADYVVGQNGFNAYGVSYNGFVADETADVLGGNLVLATDANAKNVGKYAITGSGLTSGNYAITYVDGELDITKANLVVKVDNKERTYDGLMHGLDDNEIIYTGFVGGEDASVLNDSNQQYTVNGASSAVKNAGTYTVGISGLDSANYEISYEAGVLQINKKEVVVNANDQTIEYQGHSITKADNPTGMGVNYSGFVNGEDETNALGFDASNLDYDYGDAFNVGVYGITASGLEADNYEFIYQSNGKLTVTKATLTITADGVNKIYDGLGIAGSEVTYNGFKGMDNETDLGGNLIYSGNAIGERNANADKDGNLLAGRSDYDIKVGGLTSDNYEIVFVDGKLRINQAEVQVTVDSANKTYDGKTYVAGGQQFTAQYSGFLGNDSANSLGLNADFVGNAANAINAGVYNVNIDANSLNANNYYFTLGADATLTIDKAKLVVTADSATEEYKGDFYTAGYGVQYQGFVNGEDENVLVGTLTYTLNNARNVGVYSIEASGLTSANYDIEFANGQLVINKAKLTLVVDSKVADLASFPAGYDKSQLGYTANGLVGTDTKVDLIGDGSETYLITGLRGNAVNDTGDLTHAGVYEIYMTGISSDNYEITLIGGLLAIGEKQVVISAEDQKKIYDGNTFGPNFTYKVEGVGSLADLKDSHGNQFEFDFVGDALGAVNAGSYAIELKETAGYEYLDYNDVELTPAVCAADPSNCRIVSGDYEIHFAPGVLLIDKADLLIKVKDENHTYNGQEIHFNESDLTATGFVNGEGFGQLTGAPEFNVNGGSQWAKNAGQYQVSVGGFDSNNYAIHYDFGTLVINKADLVVTANNDSKVYDAQSYAGGKGVTYEGLQGADTGSSLSGSIIYGGSSQGAVNAGNYVISASGLNSDNYNITYVDGALTVEKAQLVIKTEHDVMEFDGSKYEGTNGWKGFANAYDRVQFSGLQGNDKAQDHVTGLQFKYSGAALDANGDAVHHGLYTIEAFGASSGNYDISYSPDVAYLAIDEKPLLVVAQDAASTYNGQAQHNFAVEYIGFVNGEDESVLGGKLQFKDGANGGDLIGAGDYRFLGYGLEGADYGIHYGAGNLTIEKAKVIVTALDDHKFYDGQSYSGNAGYKYQIVDANGKLIREGLFGADALTGFNFSGSSQGAKTQGFYELGFFGQGNNPNYEVVGWNFGELEIEKRPDTGIESMLATIKNGSATGGMGAAGAMEDEPNQTTNFIGALSNERERLTGVSYGGKTIVVDLATIERVAGSSNTRVPLGRNSKVVLVNGGVKLPTNLQQEFYLEIAPGESVEEVLQSVL